MIRNFQRFLIFTLAIITIIVGSGCFHSQTSQGNLIPIRLQQANHVGSVYLVLSYDPEILIITAVKPGELTRNSLLEYNIDQVGEAVIGIADAGGISGTGDIAVLTFSKVDQSGVSKITLNSVELYDATTLVDINLRTSAGSFNAATSAITPPVIICGE